MSNKSYKELFLSHAIVFLSDGILYRAVYDKNEFGRKTSVTCAGIEYELVPVADLGLIYSRVAEDLSDEIKGAGDAKLADLRRQTAHLENDNKFYRNFVFGELLPRLTSKMGVIEVDDVYNAQFSEFEVPLGTYAYIETGKYALFNVDDIPANECYAFESVKMGMRIEHSSGSISVSDPINIEPYKHPAIPTYDPSEEDRGVLCLGVAKDKDDDARALPPAEQIVKRLNIQDYSMREGYKEGHSTVWHNLNTRYFTNQRITLDEARRRKLPIGNYVVDELV